MALLAGVALLACNGTPIPQPPARDASDSDGALSDVAVSSEDATTDHASSLDASTPADSDVVASDPPDGGDAGPSVDDAMSDVVDDLGAADADGDSFEPPSDAADALDSATTIDGGPRDSGPTGTPYSWSLPPGFPRPVVPVDNPMTVEKVELGRHLFYDERLSENQTQSCASCHRQEIAFTDDKITAVGSTGEVHPRNSMALANVAYAATFTWANPLLKTFEVQALVPMFGTQPVELGMNGKEDELLARLRATPKYVSMFDAAYGNDGDPVTLKNVVGAISSFERTLISGRSDYDRYAYDGVADAISDSAKRGLALFNSEKMECFHCHQGFNFQDAVYYEGKAFSEAIFNNTGLYNIDGKGAYPAPNTGVHSVTNRPQDMGRFRAPTLRNIEVTAPYMHDGSIATLEGVLDHYGAGGRTIATGPYAGVGSASPLKSGLIVGFTLTVDERADVLAFLRSLTDRAFLTDPRFADPGP